MTDDEREKLICRLDLLAGRARLAVLDAKNLPSTTTEFRQAIREVLGEAERLKFDSGN